ncbi:glycoside hydrolase family 76 protein [Mycolicibacterium brumae]|uniref:Fructose-bisphosphate aldolase n=1 Tax=Mycolicibacterium brumae TaxID=85968 RepID=A0A2G5PFG1_9MYCO|nr:glycoside hydrolase family 76 protein [Mycolicibacterium brumae]MCV7192613.1 fructose-bisphosphate aldolase [Mycolicibacterium brumae]PIB77057.1 fructose-bisphosphate aldolase [Mycolicibacterium brumae]RWA18395.1 fructose-bisphosphate aldolase [Mycolicibacterium brumae DSM 44177]UWW10383.1 fructose-bisphosphate aldolase [Mycolicibacterium brumae]
MEQVWANRAGSAETAINTRHLKKLWGLPGTQLGVTGWPATKKERHFGIWHYWWQAHLLDCLIDAQLRDPQAARLTQISRQIRGHWLRNTGWTNSYYDDMAWLALALQRADRQLGIEKPRALDKLASELIDSWVPEDGGGIPWRKEDQFFNAPANGPAGVFLARYGRLRRATQMADWLDETLIDPDTHLVFDGIKGGSLVRAQYTYCQGVVLGLETELAIRSNDDRHVARVRRLVAAVSEHMTENGVLRGGGGGDGGLFNGITTRYLALVAVELPGDTDEDQQARATARDIVLKSARAAWDYRQTVNGLPLFGPAWDRNAEVPGAEGKAAEFVEGAVNPSQVAERDLSTQLSGWMLMEAAHRIEAHESGADD